MDRKNSTDILNKIPIQQIGVFLGIKLPKKGSAQCPFHKDTNPSFEIKASGVRWVCYACDKRGGSIDFVKEYNQTDFLTAKKWLEDKVGNASSSIAFIKKTKLNKSAISPASGSLENSDNYSDIYEFFLTLCPILTSGKNYLFSRGITAETIELFKIAQVQTIGVLTKLLAKFSFDRVYAAGLLTKKSTAADPRIIFPTEAIIFPFIENKKVVYLQARNIRNEERYGKWRNLNFQPRRIYNIDAIAQTSKRPFAICEGVIDALSAIELGYTSVGMMGVSAKFTPDQFRLLRKKEVEILLDWDTAGEKRAQSLREELNKYGVVSIRKKLPSTTATDLNEYLKEKRGLA